MGIFMIILCMREDYNSTVRPYYVPYKCFLFFKIWVIFLRTPSDRLLLVRNNFKNSNISMTQRLKDIRRKLESARSRKGQLSEDLRVERELLKRHESDVEKNRDFTYTIGGSKGAAPGARPPLRVQILSF